MSNLAMGVAVGASIANAQNSSNSSSNKTFYCNQIMPKFNPKTATIKDKQNYADCVDHFYPTMTGTDIIVVKIIIVITILAVIYTGYRGWMEDGWMGLLLYPLVVAVIIPLALLALYLAVNFLFS